MVTVADIEREVDSNIFIRMAMNSTIKKLKDAEKDLGKDLIRDLITGDRKLDGKEYEAAIQRYGLHGVNAIQAMENLNPAQKEYLLKRLGYNE